MSFMNALSDFTDFERFFYDQLRFRPDFFEEPIAKIMK